MRQLLLLIALTTTLACSRTPPPAGAPAADKDNAIGLPTAPSPADAPTLAEAAKGQQLFIQYCALCHGKEAEGPHGVQHC